MMSDPCAPKLSPLSSFRSAHPDHYIASYGYLDHFAQGWMNIHKCRNLDENIWKYFWGYLKIIWERELWHIFGSNIWEYVSIDPFPGSKYAPSGDIFSTQLTMVTQGWLKSTRNSYLNTGSFPRNHIWICGVLKKSTFAYLKFHICIPNSNSWILE